MEDFNVDKKNFSYYYIKVFSSKVLALSVIALSFLALGAASANPGTHDYAAVIYFIIGVAMMIIEIKRKD